MAGVKRATAILCLLLCLMVNICPPTSAEEIHKHRLVVLVYDDSGSMSQNNSSNWEKANYSLQSLAALLDNGDKLYVVKMSNPNYPEEIPLESNARQNAINRIRNTPNAGDNTPFETIRTAAALLEQTSGQYERWLVISSDGQFQIAANKGCTGSVFAEFLKAFKGRTDNSSINTMFLAIGNQVPDDLKQAWDSVMGQSPMAAIQADEIIARMNEISALISCRDPDHPKDSPLQVKFGNNNSVTIHSSFPLRRLTILRQAENDTPIELRSMQVNGKSANSSLAILGPYLIGTPVGGSDSVAGRLMHIKLNSSDIPEGTYKLTFNQDISLNRKNIIFLPETAIDFNCAFFKKQGNKYIKVNNNNAHAGDIVEARIQILRTSGGKAMNIAQIADQVEAVADIGKERGIHLQADSASNAFIAKGIKLEKGKIDARFMLTVRGWYKGIKHLSLEIKQLLPRNIGLKVEPLEWRVSLDELESAAPIKLEPTINGRPMTESEFAEISNKLRLQESDLNIKIRHDKKAFFLQPCSSCGGVAFTPTGLQEVKAELTGRVPAEKALAAVHIFIEDIPWYQKYGPLVAWPLAVLLLLTYLTGLIKKPRFYKDTSYVDHISEVSNYDWEKAMPRAQELKSNWLSRYLVPFKPETVEIGSVIFMATGNVWSIKVARESMEKVLEQEGTRLRLAGSTITAEDLSGDLIMSREDELVIQRQNPDTKEWFKYLN